MRRVLLVLLFAATAVAQQPGTVILAVHDGKTVVREVTGFADVELRTPMREDMLFRLGSITKQFTAAAILKLEADGKLALSDRLAKYVAGFPETITLEHLLTHTAGVFEYTRIPEYHANLRQDATVDEIVALIRAKPLEFEPGAKYAYTNSAYFLLGAVIEKVSGESYASYLEKALFRPAGLKHTRMDSLTEIIPNRVRGYDRDAKGLRNATLYSPTRAFSVGGLLSNVDDLKRWNEYAVANFQRAFTPHKGNYGYGWFINDLDGNRVIEHGGDIPGFTTHVLTIPEKKIFVAVLSNDAQRTPRPDYTATKLALQLLGKAYEPKAITLAPEALDRFTGTYRSASGAERKVTREGTKLFVERTGGRRSEVIPMSADTFFYPDSFLSVRFEGDVMILRNRNSELDRAIRSAP